MSVIPIIASINDVEAALRHGERNPSSRWYIAKRDPRHIKRNALIALGNTGGIEHAPLLQRFAEHDDPVLAEHASWALARVGERA